MKLSVLEFERSFWESFSKLCTYESVEWIIYVRKLVFWRLVTVELITHKIKTIVAA